MKRALILTLAVCALADVEAHRQLAQQLGQKSDKALYELLNAKAHNQPF